jgi:hypothetical protein
LRVTSDKQTLILAGESVPPRADAGAQLKRVTMLLVQGEYAAAPTITVEALPSSLLAPLDEGFSDLAAADGSTAGLPAAPADYRGLSPGAAQYARTQNLSAGRSRRPIIDTYA